MVRGIGCLVFALAIATAACAGASGSPLDDEEGDVDAGSDGGGSFVPDPGACEGPLGKPVDPSTLPACCSEHPNRAACYPMDKVPVELHGVVAKCEGGAACVPSEFLKTGGVFKPKTCKSIGGPGVCLSRCIPMVEEKQALLPVDVCDEEHERCVPCINPLDKKETGACKIEGRCKGEDAGPPEDAAPIDSGPPKCPHEGPPVIEASKLPSCQCGDGHCVPKTAVPASMSDKVADCSGDPSGKCVPDVLIESGGNFVPKTCTSVGKNEGRCLSTCLPDVQAQASQLPQDVCAATEKCVPCWNPLDGKETGACKLSCDPGPTTSYKPLPKCCGGRGTCVPKSAVPASSASRLKSDGCPEEHLCAPDVFLNKTWTKRECDAATIFGPAGKGVCMPQCVNGLGFPLLKGSGCEAGEKCAPCLHPITKKPTGACELTL